MSLYEVLGTLDETTAVPLDIQDMVHRLNLDVSAERLAKYCTGARVARAAGNTAIVNTPSEDVTTRQRTAVGLLER